MHICAEEYFEFYGCMQPQIVDGVCDERFEGCGVFAEEGEQRL